MFDKEETLHRNNHKQVRILYLWEIAKLPNFNVLQSLTKIFLIIKL